jgi:HSP20 family protein
MSSEVKVIRPASSDAFRRFIDRLDNAMEQIRKRAYEIFANRGFKDGDSLDHWFAAERELFCIPESELTESDGVLYISVAVPGFHADALEITVLPKVVIVEGKWEKEAKSEKEQIYFTEFHCKHLMRRFELPAEIEADNVKAVLHNGILKITAPKVKAVVPPAPRKIEVEEPAKETVNA